MPSAPAQPIGNTGSVQPSQGITQPAERRSPTQDSSVQVDSDRQNAANQQPQQQRTVGSQRHQNDYRENNQRAQQHNGYQSQRNNGYQSQRNNGYQNQQRGKNLQQQNGYRRQRQPMQERSQQYASRKLFKFCT